MSVQPVSTHENLALSSTHHNTVTADIISGTGNFSIDNSGVGGYVATPAITVTGTATFTGASIVGLSASELDGEWTQSIVQDTESSANLSDTTIKAGKSIVLEDNTCTFNANNAVISGFALTAGHGSSVEAEVVSGTLTNNLNSATVTATGSLVATGATVSGFALTAANSNSVEADVVSGTLTNDLNSASVTATGSLVATGATVSGLALTAANSNSVEAAAVVGVLTNAIVTTSFTSSGTSTFDTVTATDSVNTGHLSIGETTSIGSKSTYQSIVVNGIASNDNVTFAQISGLPFESTDKYLLKIEVTGITAGTLGIGNAANAQYIVFKAPPGTGIQIIPLVQTTSDTNSIAPPVLFYDAENSLLTISQTAASGNDGVVTWVIHVNGTRCNSTAELPMTLEATPI